MSVLDQLGLGLAKTREGLLGSLRRLLPGSRKLTPELCEALEGALLAADVGVSVATALMDAVRGLVRQSGDPAAVAYDGVAAAQARKADVALVDTAGRLHTKSNLMDELRKVKRTLGKAMPGAPHDVWLILDATVGQNGLAQARQFHDALGVTGVILTKLDGTAKGGIVLAVAGELGLPVRYIGVGEGVEDLQAVRPAAFVDALLGES